MNEYKKLRNLVISTIRNSQRSYYKKTITANKSCDVWRAVNQSLGKNRKSSITSDLSPDAWNEHFASVGNKLCSKFGVNDELMWRNNSSIYYFKFKSLLEEDVLQYCSFETCGKFTGNIHMNSPQESSPWGIPLGESDSLPQANW